VRRRFTRLRVSPVSSLISCCTLAIATVAKNTEAGVEYADGRRKVMAPAVDATGNPLGRDTGWEQRINLTVSTSF